MLANMVIKLNTRIIAEKSKSDKIEKKHIWNCEKKHLI